MITSPKTDAATARGRAFLGTRHAVLCGAMSWVSERNLVAAISNAGGFGVIACGAMTPELLDTEIAATKALTDKPFGVNLITMHPQLMDLIAICAKHRVGHVVLAGGIPPKGSVEAIKEAGAKVLVFAPTLALAKKLLRSGADALVIEGSEAGGHIGPVSLTVLAQEILPHLRDVPVFVAGALARGDAILSYLEMGAAGAQLGTRFVCATESIAHANFKRAFLRAAARDAVPTVQLDARFPVIPVRALVNDGADIIIGPVLREGVQGAANAARGENIPVIGFSSDRSVAGNGVYLLSFQLEDEISRLVTYAASQNIHTIALLAPANEYGRRVEAALRAEAQVHGVTVTQAQLYNRTDTDAAAAATALAASFGAQPAQAVLIAESGTPLRAIGTALVRGGVDSHRVRFMGTSAWSGDAQREPTLAGGWYVSPDPNARTDFETRYAATFNQQPTRLASLAYDAVALATLLSHDVGSDGLNRRAIENSEGFAGSDGLFRFHSNGAIERGLAILQVAPTGATAVDGAPRRFSGPSS